MSQWVLKYSPYLDLRNDPENLGVKYTTLNFLCNLRMDPIRVLFTSKPFQPIVCRK